MKKKILITTLVAIVVCIGYFVTLAYQDKDDVRNGEMVQGEEVGDTEEPADEIEKTLAPIVEPTLSPTIAPTEVAKTEEPIIKTEAPLVETEEPIIDPTMEPTIKPTVGPTKQAVTKTPTIEPTKAATKKPAITKTPTKAPTKKPIVKTTVEPTIKPTVKPVKTPTPTKKAAKTYWYRVPVKEGSFIVHKYIESELPPEKYPVPDGYEPWTFLGSKYDDAVEDYVYRTQPLPEDIDNVLAYNKDGSPDLKNTVVNKLDKEFLKFIKSSNEIQNYLKSKGITSIKKFGAENTWSPYSHDVRSYIYKIEHNSSYNNGFTVLYIDKNYKITEKDPYM